MLIIKYFKNYKYLFSILEKTKALSFRSQMLQLNVEKKKKAQDQPNWGTDGF